MYCGQPVTILGVWYMFLGYTDSSHNRGVFADAHGNRHTRIMNNEIKISNTIKF